MNVAKLDTLLSLMNEKGAENPIAHQALNNYLSIIEFRDYSDKLIADGYAQLQETASEKGLYLSITRNGVRFIRSGGYTILEERKSRSKRKQQTILICSLIGLGIIVSLLFFKIYTIFQTGG